VHSSMEQAYDVIVLGTGLKECIMSGLMSSAKKKVLHVDRNSFYGGESASLNLEQLYIRFRGGATPPKELGRVRDYCVDLCPKFLMACGNLVKILLHTKVTRYLEFKAVKGSYVVHKAAIHKVPSNAVEGGTSGLMGLFQKHHFKGFITFVGQYDEADAKTHKGRDLTKLTCQALYDEYSLDANTQGFVGHALALYLDDDYLTQPALDMVQRCKLYAYSLNRYNGDSPYIYPVWGLGGLPEGFSRLCAIHGGVYMLNKPIEEILYDATGRVTGVRDAEGKVANCKQLIADPSYFLGTPKIKKTGQVARCIFILDDPIKGTNSDSAQVIIPARQCNRKSDLYICMTSSEHKVCVAKKFIAVVNGLVEGKEVKIDDVKAVEAAVEKELAAAFALIPVTKTTERFCWISDAYEPTSDGAADGCYISSTYDPTTHFEQATEEVLKMYRTVTGQDVDLSIAPDLDEEKTD